MKRFFLLFTILAFGVALGFQSCVKEELDIDEISSTFEIDASAALPLGYAKLTIRKMLKDFDTTELFQQDQTNLLYLIYEDTVFSQVAPQLIFFNAVSHQTTYNSPVAVDLSAESDYYLPLSGLEEETLTLGLSGGDEEIDSVWFKGGNLSVNVSNVPAGINGELYIEFPTLRKNGTPYSTTIPLQSGVASSENMNGYQADLTNGQTTKNTLPFSYRLEIDPSSSASIAQDDPLADISFQFSTLEYSRLYGYTGQKTFDLPTDSIEVDIYDRYDGQFHFEDPKIHFYTSNSFGLPIGGHFLELSADNTDITGSAIPTPENPLLIPYPQTINETAKGEFHFTTENTNNLFSIVENEAQKFVYSAQALINPSGYDPENPNFITDNSRLDINMQVELPLWGWADLLVLQDTLQFKFEDIYDELDLDENQEIQRIIFRLNFNNGFPVGIYTQGFFTDSLYNQVDVLFDDELIAAAPVGADGRVSENYQNPPLTVEFDRDRIESIRNTQHMIVSANIETYNQPNNVKFYSDYEFTMQVGIIVHVKGKINPEEF